METLPSRLARNMRRLRETRGLTQLAFAKLAELPRTTLAELESGHGNPTLSVLDRVATAFQVSIEELVAAPKEIGRKYARGSLEVRERGSVRVEKLLPDPVPGMEIDRFTLPPRARMVGVPHTDGTREYLACDRGKVELVASGERFELSAGDLVVFRGDQKHSYANVGDKEAVCYSVVVLAR
ncbi:MAG: XRE family transcriptional regulator [Polyangiaceae bacterium]